MTSDSGEREAGGGDDGFVDALRTAIEGLDANATLDEAYGEPITVEGKTIVPVARVLYGFGGGFGSTPETDADPGESGGGGGGGTVSLPIGVLEITDRETRFVRFTDRKRLALAVGIGIAIGRVLARR